MDNNDHSDKGWADRSDIKRLIRLVLYGICGLLLVAEFFVHRHVNHPLEGTPAFYALYGFIALIFAVITARALRWFVGRDEDYYDHDD